MCLYYHSLLISTKTTNMQLNYSSAGGLREQLLFRVYEKVETFWGKFLSFKTVQPVKWICFSQSEAVSQLGKNQSNNKKKGLKWLPAKRRR